jgi:hypothetical protein
VSYFEGVRAFRLDRRPSSGGIRRFSVRATAHTEAKRTAQQTQPYTHRKAPGFVAFTQFAVRG